MVIIEIDTPGGEVFSALKIVRAIQESQIPIIGHIKGWAISAGALISYACPKVYAQKGSIMGAATPVHVTSSTMLEAPEKINSALRAQFRSTAKLSSRNEAIAEAMVDKEICLVNRGGKIRCLLKGETVLQGDRVLFPAGKLVTLSDHELLEYGVIDAILEGPILKHTDLQAFNGTTPQEYQNNKIFIFAFLQKPIITSILSFAMLAGLYSLFSSGHFGFSSLCAIACAFLLFIAQHSSQTFAVVEWLLLALGLFCLLAEGFIPGFGILGFLGVILVLASLFVMNVAPMVSWHLPEFGFSKKEFSQRVISFCAAICVFSVLLLLFAKRIAARIFKTSPFILRDQNSFTSSPEMLQKGECGQTLSALRPWGKVNIQKSVYQVKAQDGYIETGKRVKVSFIKNNTIYVQRVTS